MGTLDRLYAKLPVWGQNLAVSAYGLYWYQLRFGSGFRQEARAYKQRESYNQLEWEKWQNERIKQIASLAAEQVPYYQQTWSTSEKAAAKAGILADLPLLEKEPLRADPAQFLRQDERIGKPHIFHTSGSSGTPIAIYWTAKELRNSMALREIRSAQWAGVSFEMPRATFSGRLVEPDPDSKGPYHRFNRIEKQVYFSAFHLRPETAKAYVEALHQHKVQWLTGYAVSWYILAQFILAQNIKVDAIKAVITTSEKVTPQMRQVMEKAYDCPVYEEYSTVENIFFAHDCPLGHMHVSPDAGLIEILRPDGTPCDSGEIGEVVATGLIRTLQPLIRFRIGDLASWSPDPCPCGRQMPVIQEVVGRIEDVVIGPDGRQMVRFHGIFVDQQAIQEGQIIQEALDHIRVVIVPAGEFSPSDQQEVIQRVRQRLGKNIQVNVELVEQIPRTSAGKFRAVICNLPQELKEALRQENE